MYHSKLLYLVIAIGLMVTACKSPWYAIQPSEILSDSLMYKINRVEGRTTNITRTATYRAVIAEKLIRKDAVAEYKLANELSQNNKDDIDIAMQGNFSELYFYELDIAEQLERNGRIYYRTKKAGVLFTANFSPDSICLGYGPIYTGTINDVKNGTKNFSTTGKYKRCKKQDAYKSCVIKMKVPELVFFYEHQSENNELSIRFQQVVQKSKNKISGIGKFLVYDVEPIFNDPQALSFKLIDFK